jgi:hypothetical protein
MRSPALCSQKSLRYWASASAIAIPSVIAATPASRRQSVAVSSNGAFRSESRWSTTSASGHGFARSAAVSTTVEPAAPASAFHWRTT